MIAALALLLAFQLAGEALRVALHLPVPGPVIGMALLLVYLILRPEGPSAELLPLMTLRRGGMKMVEGEIPYGAPCVGKPLAQISMPPGTLIITLVRGDQVILPHGGTVVEVGDVLIGLAEADRLNELRRVLFG